LLGEFWKSRKERGERGGEGWEGGEVPVGMMRMTTGGGSAARLLIGKMKVNTKEGCSRM